MNIQSLTALCFGCGVATCAMAGPYVEIGAGWARNEDEEMTDSRPGAPFPSATLSLSDGLEAHVAGGWDFDTGAAVDARVELEAGHRMTEYDTATVPGLGAGKLDGKSSMTTLMVNAFADIRLADPSPAGHGALDWYVGAGVGMARVHTDDAKVNGTTMAEGWDRSVLAGQAMTGLTFHFDAHWALGGGYRFFITEGTDANGRHYDGSSAHALELGLRYTF